MNDRPLLSESDLFKPQLGDDWHSVNRDIQNRFSETITVNQPLAYQGVMASILISGPGTVFAMIGSFAGAIVPYSGENVPVEVLLFKKDNDPFLYKKRVYYFHGKKPFTILSKLALSSKGEMLETVKYGLATKFTPNVINENLYFVSTRYIWQIANFSLPLPHFLASGTITLAHENISQSHFKIIMNIQHPLLGPMYYQEGEFEQVTPDKLECFQKQTSP